MNQCKSAPTFGRNRGASQNHNPTGLHSQHSTSPIHVLLDRLDDPRKYGEGWRAPCPAHEGKSRSTLSIRETDDGKVLLHCFAGCGALDVVQSLGLELKDLFERPITANMTPEEQKRLRQLAQQGRIKTAIKSLSLEIRVVEITAQDMASGKQLTAADQQRLELACERIRNAKAVFCER